MYSNQLDQLIDKMTLDILSAGDPKPDDVMAWADEWARWNADASAADIGVWFIRCYLPVARAAINRPSSR